MERIVLGISAINFDNSNDILTEIPIVSNAAAAVDCWSSSFNESFSLTMAAAMNSVDSVDDFLESPANTGESSDQTEPESTPPQRRRNVPARLAKSKENSLLRIKRRSIMKPRRNLNMEIKKIYLDNKVKGNFRPANLETIFEEPTPDKNKQLCFIGAKKIRRSLSCSDGLNVTKTTVKLRRNKIKKTFGRKFALRKISLDDFIDRLNASFEDNTSRSVIPPPIEKKAGDGMECSNETLLLM